MAAACLDGVNIFHADAPSSLPDSHAAYFKETHSIFRLVFLFLCFDFLILQQISTESFWDSILGFDHIGTFEDFELQTMLVINEVGGKSDGDKKYDQICLIHLKKK